MRVVTMTGLCLIAVALAACSEGPAVLGPPSFDVVPPTDPWGLADCIHVDPGDGISAECGDDGPEEEGAPPSVYVDGDSVSEPRP